MQKDAKSALRAQLKRQRQELGEELRGEWSQKVSQRLARWLKTQSFDRLLAFRSFEDELAINGLVDSLSLRYDVGLPVCGPRGQMDFYPYRFGDKLAANPWGIDEPVERVAKLAVSPQTIVLVPALALDFRGHRLGYGGGYYDRFFSLNPKATKLGLIFSCFMGLELPYEAHDIPLDYICDEKELRKV